MLLFPNGSGTTDIAARCLRAGVAIVGDAASITAAQLSGYADMLCNRSYWRQSARNMQREFAAYKPPTIAADLLEELGSSGTPVRRRAYNAVRSQQPSES